MITTTIETIDPSKAKEYLLWNKHNRPVNKFTVKQYAQEMKDGRWTLSNDAITFFENHLLGNGQHRLYAIIESDYTGQFLVMRGLPAETFSNIDQGKKRTPSDNFNIGEIPNAANVSSIVRSYHFLKNGITSNSRMCSTTLALEIYNQHPDMFQEAYRKTAITYNACRVMRISLFGGLYAHLVIDKHHDPEKVERFIQECAGIEPNTKSNSPQLLRSLFITYATSKSKNMSMPYRIGLLIKAWNYWITGKEIARLNVGYNEKNLEFI